MTGPRAAPGIADEEPGKFASSVRAGSRRVQLSELALIVARIASMGLGFVAWLVAARVLDPAQIGIASALVGAMMLCVQIGLLGIGSAVVATVHRDTASARQVVGTGMAAVSAVATAVAVAFIVVAALASADLRVIATPSHAAAFLAMTLFGTLNTYFDYVSIALRRGDQVLVRNVAFGIATIGVLGILAVLPSALDAMGALAVLVAWAAAGAIACGIAILQIGRELHAVPAFSVDWSRTRNLVAVGLPNWTLTLAERAPALLMPVLVAEFLSPETNAFWYAAWMMAWVVLIIPVSIGQSTFAEVARQPSDARHAVLRSIRTSLAYGVPAAIGVAVLADVGLGLLGERYVQAGDAALRVLVFTVIPVTVIQAYYAVGRAVGSLREPILLGICGGIVTLVTAVAAGLAGGLVAMAAAWLAVQTILAAWAALRLWTLLRQPHPVARAS